MIKKFFIYCEKNASRLSLNNSQEFKLQCQLEGLPTLEQLNADEAAFQFVDNHLLLHCLLDNKLCQLNFDFVDGEVGFRAARVSKANELVSRAIGCKPYYRPKVLDATAGMGRDSLIMALLGCDVVMQERNFAIYQLLSNALQQFKLDSHFMEVSSRLTLIQQNSLNSFRSVEGIEVIYLDPMFPNRKKSALVKKEMRLFKLLAGEDHDADLLLENALQSSAKRIVVKRPKGAPVLANKKPSHEILAKKFRYDVYLLNN